MPGFAAARAGRSPSCASPSAWLDRADPLVRARLEEAASRVPAARARRAPDGRRHCAARSCARSRTSTASSGRSTPSSTATTSAPKIERCLAVDRRRGGRGRRAARAYRAVMLELLDAARPAADADAPVRRAAGGRRRDRGARVVHPVHVAVQRARLAGARAAVRRRRGRAARRRCSSSVGPATMRSCSAPGSRSRRLCGAERVNADLAFAQRLADAADALTLRALPRARPARRDEARPDARQRGRPRGRGGDPRARRATRPGEGVLGEEFGDDGTRRRAGSSTRSTGRGTTSAASRCGRRCWHSSARAASTSAVVSAPALDRRWWAVRGEGAWAGDGERCQRRRRRAARGRRRLDDDRARNAAGLARRSPSARGHRAASATSGSTASSPRARSTRHRPGAPLWDYAAVQLIVEEAGGRCTTFAGDASRARRVVPRRERRPPRRGGRGARAPDRHVAAAADRAS